MFCFLYVFIFSSTPSFFFLGISMLQAAQLIGIYSVRSTLKINIQV